MGQNVRQVMASGRSAKSKDEESAFNLPFDELDPCCQKEIVNADHHARVGAQLRKHDRSKLREDERMKAFNSLRQGFGCICGADDCLTDGDYPLLAMLRTSKNDDEVFNALGQGSAAAAAERAASDVEDSDDDSLLFGLGDEFRTEEEQERMLEWAEKQAAMESAIKMGYAQHIEDNPVHLRTLLDNKQSLVLHICDTNSILCAALDLALEKLASVYIGTKFRRLQMSPDSSYFLGSELERQRQQCGTAQVSNLRQKNEGASLVCFKDGILCALESQLGQFGLEDTVFEADLTKYLESAHVLSADVAELSPENLQAMQAAAAAEEEFIDEDASYCGFPGCGRKYSHSHVQAGADSLVKSDKEEGMEALADNVFTRM